MAHCPHLWEALGEHAGNEEGGKAIDGEIELHEGWVSDVANLIAISRRRHRDQALDAGQGEGASELIGGLFLAPRLVV